MTPIHDKLPQNPPQTNQRRQDNNSVHNEGDEKNTSTLTSTLRSIKDSEIGFTNKIHNQDPQTGSTNRIHKQDPQT